MENNTILVLADPTDPILAMLECLPDATTIAAGNNVEAFERTAADANVIFSWSIGGSLLERVFAMAPRVRWIHSRAAGLDGVLFPALVESPVPLTNGRGVFSESLGEFVVGAAIFFAKDFRRMLRSQEAGVWDQFDVAADRGLDHGDRRLRRYRPRHRQARARLRHEGAGAAPAAGAVGGRSAGGRGLSARAKAGDAGPMRLHRRRRAAHAGNARHDRRAGTSRHEEDGGGDERRPRAR